MNPLKRRDMAPRNSASASPWAVDAARATNRAKDRLLATRLGQWPRQSWETWRSVRSAAEGLLSFAYEPIAWKRGPAHRRLRERVVREFNDLHKHVARWWILARPPQWSMSDRRIRSLQREIRVALVWLVLLPNDRTEARTLRWIPPQLRVAWIFHFEALDRVRVEVQVKPAEQQALIFAQGVLVDALPWLRFCELCGRIFFKVKRQQVCSRRCRVVFQARARSARTRKGDETERRGRPRTNYAAPIEAEHSAWIRAAQERAKRVGDGVSTPPPEIDFSEFAESADHRD